MITLAHFARRAAASRRSRSCSARRLRSARHRDAGRPARAPPAARPPRRAGTTPLVQATWPVRTREHVDLWLHAYALLTRDSTLVPYFRARLSRPDHRAAAPARRDVAARREPRAAARARSAVQPSLATGPQFLPFYFASWEQMRQVIDLFIRADGNPRATNDPALQHVLRDARRLVPDRRPTASGCACSSNRWTTRAGSSTTTTGLSESRARAGIGRARRLALAAARGGRRSSDS